MKRILPILAISIMMSSCQCSDQNQDEPSGFTSEDAKVEGKRITDESQAALSSALMSKINSDGFEAAVSYCNLQAPVLTDSLSLLFNATVRRTSLRLRNPNNAPDTTDRGILYTFEELHERDIKPEPMLLERKDGTMRYYSPIIVAPICLNCHGMPGEELSADLHALILDEYPEDNAVEYEKGDVRGAWVVEFAESMVDVQ